MYVADKEDAHWVERKVKIWTNVEEVCQMIFFCLFLYANFKPVSYEEKTRSFFLPPFGLVGRRMHFPFASTKNQSLNACSTRVVRMLCLDSEGEIRLAINVTHCLFSRPLSA